MQPIDDIIPLIPQKQPFVMVGRLLYADETVTRSSFVISPDNVFVKDGILQEAGLMENIAQTAALRAGYMAQKENRPVETGYIGAIKDFEVFSLPVAEDEITTEITIDNQVFNVTMLTGQVWRNDVLLARCEMKVFVGQ
ncbi:3-hydroxyacyl-ACP dehydratase [Mucilaginibacter sp. L3T2-6]|uniref:3-hydroxyacyl-ACP dehydratase n=1 Tax=Mucilaginibacter sp. L3T2-6 TaxID=3062491 RepID=UPI002675BECB|nr:3-hydroxyacyl-ACP dehydratase [Mucilaginibacter sp. L3T2-6]MDO3640842.1 3-hydroxyacyl-ACP dehydratase [Mucilaginibacter sp. L3T2-6]MDV6213682.1 3-hydroxyacyl-ACP dehydratase [Mucilaginibacter sp. L3T2-6]